MNPFKIATWNVNSLKVRLPHVLRWLELHNPDLIALQETKIQDEFFPIQEIKNAGYQSIFSGQKAYNGMAILCKRNCPDVIRDFPGMEDVQRRILATTINGVRILNIYIPNGESVISEKYTYKLNWLEHLHRFLRLELQKYPRMIVLGDFNIAPKDEDVHNPKVWEGRVLFTDKEKSAFQTILDIGFNDSFRLFDQPEKSFSYWDYRMGAFKRNLGLRIDHILISSALKEECTKCYIDKTPRSEERPSDHVPVIAEFNTEVFA